MGLVIVEVITRAEEEFDIEIPDEHAQELRTVGDLADYIASKMPLGPSPELWELVRAMVADEISVPLERVRRESRFVEDLDIG